MPMLIQAYTERMMANATAEQVAPHHQGSRYHKYLPEELNPAEETTAIPLAADSRSYPRREQLFGDGKLKTT